MMLKYSTYRSIYSDDSCVRMRASHPIISRRLSECNRRMAAFIIPFVKIIRTGVLVKLMLAAVLLLSGFVVVGNVFAESADMMKVHKRVVVEPGDTLWGIAASHKPEKTATLNYIEGIKRLNGLESSRIMAGDVLSLP